MNHQNTVQSEAIYIYALLAGIAGFWRFDSIGIGVLFAAVCAGVIYAAQNDYFSQAWQQMEPQLKTLYRWLLSFFEKETEPEKTAPYVICPGQDIETRQYIVTDLQELGSFMVIGMTGSGKTSLIHSILHQLLCNSNPVDLRLIIADLKEGLDFRPYKKLPHLLLPIAIEATGAKRQIDYLIEEMENRAKLFKAIPEDRFCNSLDDYHRLGADFGLPRLPRIVMIVDEFQTLTNETDSPEALNGMVKLAKKGRAFGISLIPCTQLGNVGAIPTALKSQMGSLFCGYLTNPSHYYKIMEIAKEYWEPFHASGKVMGRFIANIAGEISIIQSIYFGKRELEDVARKWSESRTEPEWPKIERKMTNSNPVLWAGSDDEKRAMLMSWFAGFSEMPTLAEFQERFGASQGTYYNWVPRTWDER